MSRCLTIATPCYNEAGSLPSYFDRIEDVRQRLTADGWQVRLVLIDDGSRDHTGELLDAYAARHDGTLVVHHPRNLGYGGAIKTALALGQNADWIAFVDSDSNYDQRLIPAMLARLAPAVDLVNVSILAPGGGAGYPWYRLLMSASASLIYRVIFPVRTRGVYTMTCGFRVYRATLVPKIFPRADDFAATAEIMLRALLTGARVIDFPASNARREHGVSKMRFLRVSLNHLRLALLTRFGMLSPPASIEGHLHRIGFTIDAAQECHTKST